MTMNNANTFTNANTSEFTPMSELLYQGERVEGMELLPEAVPLFATTAFNQPTLSDVRHAYDSKGYTYIRCKNPNRETLGQAVSFLEDGEATLITSAGMAAISTTLFHLLKAGDHVVCNADIYGETLNIMQDILPKFGIETTLVSFMDMDDVAAAIRPNTRIVYTEVVSNPCIRLADIEAAARIAHAHDALLIVDNTFTSGVNIKPIRLGADIVINSMTKFMNGHSDAIGGSITSTRERIEKLDLDCRLFGTPGSPYDSWMILRGMRTVDLRVERQALNAAALARALEKEPHILRVLHPALESNPQHALAQRMFDGDKITGMLSFEVPEDMDKIDEFMRCLHFAHYAMTLGGFRSSLSHPVVSSHNHVPDDIRRKMGITPGLFRLSVGIENVDDLIRDFHQALEVFD